MWRDICRHIRPEPQMELDSMIASPLLCMLTMLVD